MIQRKQTLYLFVAGVVTFILLFIPFGHLSTEIAYFKYTAFSVREATPDNTFITNTAGCALLLIATSVLSFISVFLYKNRKVQINLISLNMLVILGTIFTVMYVYPNFIFPKNDILKGALIDFNYTILISFVSAIGLYLAKKSIAKDEAMIRSADRLR
jgi:hypothetical protein